MVVLENKNMISDLKVSYLNGEVNVTLSIGSDNDNLPYGLSEIFAKVINDSSANPNIVIEELINEFGYDRN